jgi:hypothetical protein
MYEFVFEAAWISVEFAIPVGLIWGWVRWWKQGIKGGLLPILSLIGFSLATASALLGISTDIYARAIGGFPAYDPTLLSIYRYGALVSLAGIVFSLVGIWKPGAVRWHALACGVGTLLYWFLQASTE